MLSIILSASIPRNRKRPKRCQLTPRITSSFSCSSDLIEASGCWYIVGSLSKLGIKLDDWSRCLVGVEWLMATGLAELLDQWLEDGELAKSLAHQSFLVCSGQSVKSRDDDAPCVVLMFDSDSKAGGLREDWETLAANWGDGVCWWGEGVHCLERFCLYMSVRGSDEQ